MPVETANGGAGGHDAAISFEPSEKVVTVARVVTDDGWSVSAPTDKELKALVNDKLEAARRVAADANDAVAKWEAVLGVIE